MPLNLGDLMPLSLGSLMLLNLGDKFELHLLLNLYFEADFFFKMLSSTYNLKLILLWLDVEFEFGVARCQIWYLDPYFANSNDSALKSNNLDCS